MSAAASDHYALLGVPYDCSPAILASAYRAHALLLHPDKALHLDAAQRARKAEQFLHLQQAYAVLRHAESRELYDAALKAGGLLTRFNGPGSSSGGGVLSCTEVDLDDLAYDESSECYSYVCRCGGRMEVTEAALRSGIDLFPCHQCSIVVRILFEWEPEVDDAGLDDAAEASASVASSETAS